MQDQYSTICDGCNRIADHYIRTASGMNLCLRPEDPSDQCAEAKQD